MTGLGPQYLFLSCALEQMFSDGSPAEFTPIGEWVREHSVFNMMKQLRFFRNYMVGMGMRGHAHMWEEKKVCKETLIGEKGRDFPPLYSFLHATSTGDQDAADVAQGSQGAGICTRPEEP